MGLFGSFQPFWKAEFIPPLLFQPHIEEEVCGGTRCHRMSMPEVAFLMEIRRGSLALSVQEGETLLFFFPLSPFLRDYI